MHVPLLLVTHAQDEALAMSNQAVLLVRGHVEKLGDLHEILSASREPSLAGSSDAADETAG
jgi:ABC-type molybdate transport system ATPase subunit